MVTIVSSSEDYDGYCRNLQELHMGLQNGEIVFQGSVQVWQPSQFTFTSSRIYDFTRSAAKNVIRLQMARFLKQRLPEWQVQDHKRMMQAFAFMFKYQDPYKDAYEEYLADVGQSYSESLRVFMFHPPNPHEPYVAHVTFNCTSVKVAPALYTVNAALTCHRYSYFERVQPTPLIRLEPVLLALQNLNLQN